MNFEQFLANNGVSNKRTGRPVKPQQYKFYTDLCERKRIEKKEKENFNPKSLAEEIERIKELEDKLSPPQYDKIKGLIEEINALGGAFNRKSKKQEHVVMSEEEITSLTGGREGTASAVINWLMERRTELNVIAPPSDAQLDIMVEWYLCPDIPFEAFDINKKVDVDVEGKTMWRYMTQEEFREEIRKNMTRSDASGFIDKYRSDYYGWKQTRITQAQKNLIRDLEERLNVIEPVSDGQTVTWVNGELVTESKGKRQSRTRREERGGYNCLTDEQLDMFSYQEASDWIERLRWENSNKQVKTMHGEEDVYEYREVNRSVAEKETAKAQEFAQLNDLIYSIEAILGYEDQEAHNKVKELIMEDGEKKEDKEYLRNFFLATVTSKDKDTRTKELARIYNMCADVQIALDILTGEQ